MKRRWMMVMAARCALVVATLLVATPASTALAAGPPVINRFHDEGGPSVAGDLSKECGFEVQGSFSVNVTIRHFPDGTRLIETFGAPNHLTFTANGNKVTFGEVGHEIGRIAPGGTLTYSSSGRSWLDEFVGHRVLDPNSDDFIFEKGHSVDRQQVCTRLAP